MSGLTTRTKSARSKSRNASPTVGALFHLRTWDIRYPQGQERITDAFYEEITQ
jgi:hypothetical protein